jgi:hypothetical protein
MTIRLPRSAQLDCAGQDRLRIIRPEWAMQRLKASSLGEARSSRA